MPACLGLVLTPALPLGSLTCPFAQTDPKTHPEIPSLSCSFIQTRRSFLYQEFSPLQALFPMHFPAAYLNPPCNGILAGLAMAAGRRGATEWRVPGIKHDICVLWGKEGSVWAEPGAPGIWFHTPFCSQPCPSPSCSPTSLLSMRRGRCRGSSVSSEAGSPPCTPAIRSGPCQAWQSLGGRGGG